MSRSCKPVVFPISLPVSLKLQGCRPGHVPRFSSRLNTNGNTVVLIRFRLSYTKGQDVVVPGSLGCALGLPAATCWPGSAFLLSLEALSASCRALLSAFNSALLLAGLSVGVGDSKTGTEARAGTAGGAVRHQEHHFVGEETFENLQ